MKKQLKKLCILMVFTLLVSPLLSSQLAYAEGMLYRTPKGSQDIIVPFKDIIILKKKVLNGKIYLRWFNSTTGEWVGDWFLANP